MRDADAEMKGDPFVQEWSLLAEDCTHRKFMLRGPDRAPIQQPQR
jgi:hypothetical protein